MQLWTLFRYAAAGHAHCPLSAGSAESCSKCLVSYVNLKCNSTRKAKSRQAREPTTAGAIRIMLELEAQPGGVTGGSSSAGGGDLCRVLYAMSVCEETDCTVLLPHPLPAMAPPSHPDCCSFPPPLIAAPSQRPVA